MGSDDNPRWTVSELKEIVGHPAHVTELLGVGNPSPIWSPEVFWKYSMRWEEKRRGIFCLYGVLVL